MSNLLVLTHFFLPFNSFSLNQFLFFSYSSLRHRKFHVARRTKESSPTLVLISTLVDVSSGSCHLETHSSQFLSFAHFCASYFTSRLFWRKEWRREKRIEEWRSQKNLPPICASVISWWISLIEEPEREREREMNGRSMKEREKWMEEVWKRERAKKIASHFTFSYLWLNFHCKNGCNFELVFLPVLLFSFLRSFFHCFSSVFPFFSLSMFQEERHKKIQAFYDGIVEINTSNWEDKNFLKKRFPEDWIMIWWRFMLFDGNRKREEWKRNEVRKLLREFTVSLRSRIGRIGIGLPERERERYEREEVKRIGNLSCQVAITKSRKTRMFEQRKRRRRRLKLGSEVEWDNKQNIIIKT